MLKHLGDEAQALLLDATQFLGNPTPATVERAPGKGRGYCALQSKFLVVTSRDSAVYNFPNWKRTTNKLVRVEAFAGGQDLSPADFWKTALLFQPDLVIPLSDEIPAEADAMRSKLSVHRSVRWLDDILEAAKNSKADANLPGILAPIQGGVSTESRRNNAAECAKRSGLFGYAISGLLTGETSEQLREIVDVVNAELPTEAFKLAQGALTPDGLLEAISQGVDCFDATYATQVTAAGFALDFEGAGRPEGARGGHDDIKLNMLDFSFKEDTQPPVPNCSCFTCQNHSRAYLYHLLVVHEMTAQILLELHNLHELQRWFKDIRAAISEQRFEQFCEEFKTRRSRFSLGLAS